MDDSCAVCAETLEWVSYGACGHKEVCSTCVARLRFICEDRRCCICKTESNAVFVTKALGDYTRMINDFSVFPSEVKEGRVGSYWYHEDTQAFFDDLDHYKMIKAMCRLSCSVCDSKVEERQPADGSKKRARFRNIEQLKGHLFHQHRLLMCSLCLEGRKVFICEQKLYTRAQLKHHISTGDSEVDGTENERGGFMGHPVCEFCRTPYYGDNELYLHMSTEHYTCHICQRQHPGQYEYYKNYDDLEIHFRQEHFLCEDEACLVKKFIVFQSEAEMKRHNTLEHGGRMSRAQRSAALQIPTSFRYRQSNEQENRRGRGRMFRRDDVDLSMAIEASLAASNNNADPPLSSNARVVGDHGERDRDDIITDPSLIIQPFESLSTTSMDSEPPSRYLQAVSQRLRIAPLEDSSFPPLAPGPSGGGGGGPNQQHDHPEAPLTKNNNTMAAHLRRQSNKRSESNVHRNNNRTPQQVWPTPTSSRGPMAPVTVNVRPPANSAPGPSLATAQSKPSTDNVSLSSSSYSSLAQAGSASSVQDHPSAASSSSSSKNWSSSSGRISHSTSAPNLVETGGSFDNSMSDFPPVSSVVQMRKVPATVVSTQQQQVVDVHSANKSLVERIQAALDFDQDKYTAFKDISGEYRKGLLDTGTYLAYVEQFGLPHLVPELASLLPDPLKQKELVDTYNANLVRQNGWIMNGGAVRPREGGGGGSKKGKGKSSLAENINNSKDKLADDIISTVKKLQAGFKPSEEGEVESLSKDGYRAVKGKSKSVVIEPPNELTPPPSQPLVKLKGQDDSQSTGGVSNQNSGGHGDGRSKQKKKTSKFQRIRLGDGSLAAHLDSRNSDPDPDPDLDRRNENPAGEGLPVRGVWRNGGGHKLLSMTSARDPKK